MKKANDPVSSSLHANAFEQMIEIDPVTNNYHILFTSDTLKQVLPFTGKHYETVKYLSRFIIHPDDREAYLDFWQPDKLLRFMKGDTVKVMASHEFRICLPGRSDYFWQEEIIFPIFKEHKDNLYIMCILRNIQEEKNYEVQFRYNAHISLPRESEFFRQARLFLDSHPGRMMAMVAMDIRNFRLYNELFGRNAGNARLETINKILTKDFCEAKQAIAGYLGGDNFCLIQAYPEKVRYDSADFVKKVTNRFENYLKDVPFMKGFSLIAGVYQVHEPSDSVHFMYDCARSAIELIRQNMTKSINFYNQEEHKKSIEDQRRLMQIIDGLHKKEFTFFLQPQCEIKTGKIIGAEALARWIHEDELISPGLFIPLMEEHGYISMLDQYIWEEVFKWQRSMIDRGLTPLPCSVNISRADFYYINVAETFDHLLKQYKLDPGLVKVEITESAYAEDIGTIAKQVIAMKKGGLSVLLDDFGTGYSSLNSLHDMKVDVIKSDMKFMRMGTEGYHLLEFILNTANTLGAPVISEGVETKENVDELVKRGGKLAQGYYFYKPMPVAEYEKLLIEGK